MVYQQVVSHLSMECTVVQIIVRILLHSLAIRKTVSSENSTSLDLEPTYWTAT